MVDQNHVDDDLVDPFVLAGSSWKDEASGCEDGLERETDNLHDDLFSLRRCLVLHHLFRKAALSG